MGAQCPDCGSTRRRIKTAAGDGWLCLDCDATAAIDAVAAICDSLGLEDAVCNACGNRWSLSKPPDEYAELRCPRGSGCRSRDVSIDETPAFAFGLAEALSDVPDRGYREAVVGAACVYLGSILAGEKLTQSLAASAADVSTSTMRQSYRDFYDESGFADRYGEVGPGGERDPPTVNPAIDVEGWRKHLEAKGDTHGAVKTGASNVRRFAKWYDGEAEPAADDVAAFLDYLADEGYAPSTIQSRWEDIRLYFRWAGLGELSDTDVDLDGHLVQAYQQKA